MYERDHASTLTPSLLFPKPSPFPCPSSPLRLFLRCFPHLRPSKHPKSPNALSLRRKEPTYQGRRNAPTESPKTIIPRALLRSYKERLHHLCKVTEAFLPRASSSPYIGDLDAPSEGLTALMLRGILAIYNKRISASAGERRGGPRGLGAGHHSPRVRGKHIIGGRRRDRR